MTPIKLQPAVEKIREVVASHRLAPGSYSRWLWQNASSTRELGENPYGCADAANILYSIGDFPRELAEREASVAVLRAMQSSETGLFHESTHHPTHTTAHCMAALELFDAAPLHRAYELEQFMTREALDAYLTALDWECRPWPQSHQGAGIYVSLNLGGTDTLEFNRDYFDWLWNHADPETGMWIVRTDGSRPLYEYMAGSFHYLFNHEHAHMPLRYPERMIDSCLKMYDDGSIFKARPFGKHADFLEVDWIFCLTRASRQTPHRFYEVREHLERFAEGYADFWLSADYAANESINDLHMLFGGVCALAELQQTLRGKLLTDKPLKLVLDRRPFI